MVSFINVPAPDRGPSIGEQIGRSFGAGFGGAMQQAASGYLQGKMQQMFANQERERVLPIAQKLTRSFNLPDEVAPLIAENPSFLPTLLQTMPRPLSDFGIKDTETKIAQPPPSSIAPFETIRSNIPQQNLQPTPRSLSQRATGMPEEGYVPFVKEEMQRQAQQAPYQAQLIAQAAEASKAGVKPFPSVPRKEGEEEITIPEPPKKPSQEKYIQEMRNARTKPQQDEITRRYEKEKRDYREDLIARNKAISQESAIKEMEFRKAEAEKKTAREVSQKNVGEFIQSTRDEATTAAQQRPFLNQMRAGINQMNSGLLSPDNLADLTHIDAFRTTTGEQLRGAAKEYWLSDIKGVGGKANMMLDKALMSVLPNAGKTKAANLGLVELQQMKSDLALGKWAIAQELLPTYIDKNGVPKQNLQDEVIKRFLKYGDEVQNKTAFNIQRHAEMGYSKDDYRNETYDQRGGFKKVKNIYLTPERARYFEDLTHGDKNKAIQVALKLGYKIPEINWAEGNENE